MLCDMKKWFYGWKTAWNNLKSLGILLAPIMAMLSIVMTCALLFCTYGLDEVANAQEILQNKRTYRIYTRGWQEASAYSLRSILYESNLPEVEAFIGGVRVLSCEAAESEGNALTSANTGYVKYTEFEGYAVFPEEKYCDYAYELVEGRWFTDEELEEGSQVVVLSKQWSRIHESEIDGETLWINSTPYQVIGTVVGNEEDPDRDRNNYIPFNTISNENNHTGFTTDASLIVRYKHQLSATEREWIERCFGTDGQREYSIQSLYEVQKSGILFNTILLILLVGVMLFIASFNVLGLLKYILSRNIRRIMIYNVHGATPGDSFLVLTQVVLLVSLLVDAIALLLYNVLQHMLGMTLSMGIQLLLCLIFALCLETISARSIRRYAGVMPLSDAEWRMYES